tara:strand:- start:4210 stop:5451 length:1242 start_codon:yes stop_codon:yes gene_type:complete
MTDNECSNFQNIEKGKLSENILHFARLLRSAGLPIGPGSVIDAITAVNKIELSQRSDFYWCLNAVFVNRHDQLEMFNQAFHIFWRNPKFLERIMSLALPSSADDSLEETDLISPRLAEVLPDGHQLNERLDEPELETQFDAVMTWSQNEMLRELDFEKMTQAEMEEAKKIMKRLTLPLKEMPTRRFHSHFRGTRTDIRAMLRHSLRYGGDYIPLKKKSRRHRPPPLTVLCDISGSMERYSRMLLHFIHALTNDRDRVQSFLFGTRLTNITRLLQQKDVDVALKTVSATIEDWSGGTRIGHCLEEFNKKWSRRTLAQNSVILLISDGLDRDAGTGLKAAMERLHKSCNRLIWLNPLLRYDAFEPKPLGVRAILPFVDDFRSVHNLNSLSQLADTLNRNRPHEEISMKNWRERAA